MRRREARLILGVDEDAAELTTETIKSAFRRYALKHHPDRNPDNPVAEEAFKEGAHAYRLLTGQEIGADLDTLFEQFEDIEQSLDQMKQSFDEFGNMKRLPYEGRRTRCANMGYYALGGTKWRIWLLGGGRGRHLFLRGRGAGVTRPTLSRGSVVLTRFPFTDLTGASLRPAVLVSQVQPFQTRGIEYAKTCWLWNTRRPNEKKNEKISRLPD